MKTEKYYFRYEEDDTCYYLDYHLEEAEEEGLVEITLFEATPYNDPHYIYCKLDSGFSDIDECKKLYCSSYKSYRKDGRGGICKFRSKLHRAGKEVSFKISL